MSQKTVIQFLNYQPRVYSGFDKFLIALSSRLQSAGYQVVFVFYKDLLNAPQLQKDIEQEGIKIELLDDDLSKIGFSLQVFRLFKHYRPKLVHIHFDDIAKLIITSCSLLLRVPMITSVHSELTPYSIEDYRKKKGILKYTLFKTYLNLLKWSGRYCLCVSRQIKDQYISFSGHSDKIKVVYLGLEAPKTLQSKTTIRSKLDLPASHILICNVSAIEYIKGLDTIVEALHILKVNYEHEKFTFYHIGGLRSGDKTSDYLNELKKLIMEKGLENHFKWMGIRNDIIEILPAFDIYIQPSRKEGLPVSLMEACAVELPCIGTKVSGIPEIIEDKCNGFVIDPNSPQQLAEKLARSMKDSKLRYEMGKKSHSIFSKYFQLDSQVKKTLNLYSNIIPLENFSTNNIVVKVF